LAVYEYQCESCGLQFEKRKAMSKSADPEDCPACGTEARKLVTAANFSFKHPSNQTRGVAPPSTGTSDDWNFDKTIGRDAAKRWEKIEERQAYKHGVLRHERQDKRVDAKPEHLVRTREGAGDYRVMTEPERKAINERRAAADAVRKQLNTPSGE
jgi:putative FmdB family regulatory protein